MRINFDQLNAKYLLIICLLLFIVLLSIIFLLNREATISQSNSLTTSPTPMASAWQTLRQTNFSIQYPSDWKVERKNLTDGRTMSIISPVTSAPNTLEQVEVLTKPNATEQDLNNLINTLEYVGYTKSTAVFLGKPATKLVKKISKDSFIGPSPYTKDVQKEAYIFLNAKGLYQVDYIYYADDPSVLPELYQIAGSFTDQ